MTAAAARSCLGQKPVGNQTRGCELKQWVFGGGDMSTTTILLIVLILLLVGALPTWPYSGGWGYYPSGGLGLVVLILIVLLLLGRI